jgi:hypothetical protein
VLVPVNRVQSPISTASANPVSVEIPWRSSSFESRCRARRRGCSGRRGIASPGFRDPFAGYIWPGALSKLPTHGMGLWLVRRLCDRVDILNIPDECTIRLTVLRRHPHPQTPPSS